MATTMETARVIYLCRNAACKHTWAIDYEVHRRFVAGRPVYQLFRLAEVKGIISYVGDSHDARCPKCKSRRVQANEVKGHYSEHPCDPRCTTARGPICECSCGGANHGASYL